MPTTSGQLLPVTTPSFYALLRRVPDFGEVDLAGAGLGATGLAGGDFGEVDLAEADLGGAATSAAET